MATTTLPLGTKDKIESLKEYFSKRSDISMAFLFGSYVQGRNMSESDFDIAVYFKPKTNILEWESKEYYEDEDKIWGDIEKIIALRTDFVVLNRAPANLFYSIMDGGFAIIIKDKPLYLRLFLMISSAAEYFREFTEDFWKIKERSMSLTDIDKNRLIRIVDFLNDELKDYNKFDGINQKDYELNVELRRNVERWAENIVNSSIDIAKIILASEKKRIPQTYREVMEELSLVKNFKPKTAEKLSQFAKLRNILAHEYLDIRFYQIKKFAEESESIYKELLNFTKNFIAK